MYRFWDSITGSLLDIVRPKVIVEVGSDYGPNTRNLLEFCQRHDATLHVVDPVPKYDVAEWTERHGEYAIFHQSTSLEALREIEGFDVVFIDGDHNWYTVFNELTLINRRSEEISQPFPLVALHDVGWPYGRRDSYYDYDGIPENQRQPCAKKGMIPGDAGLAEKGGLNQGFPNATSEGGARNGVLTAVEDFLVQTHWEIETITIHGLHGLGLLVPSYLKEQNPGLGEFLATLELPSAMARHLERVEEGRLEAEIGRQELRTELRRLEARRKREMETRQEGGPQTGEDLRQQLHNLRRRNKALREKVELLEEQIKASQNT